MHSRFGCHGRHADHDFPTPLIDVQRNHVVILEGTDKQLRAHLMQLSEGVLSFLHAPSLRQCDIALLRVAQLAGINLDAIQQQLLHRSKSTRAVSHVGEANHKLTTISEVRASERRDSRRYGQKRLVEVATLPGGFLRQTVDDWFNLNRGPFTARGEEAERERERERVPPHSGTCMRECAHGQLACSRSILLNTVFVKGA